jgi:undecaprenyl-diphosphatase
MPRPERRTLFRLTGGLFALLAVMTGIGWAVTHRLAHDWPFTVEDGLDLSLARARTSGLDRLTSLVSTMSSTPYAVGLTALAAVVSWLVFRRWAEPAFLVGAVAVEAAVFLATTLLIDRSRPAVTELDGAPPTSSFPSGHTAAALALYGGVALLARRGGAGWPVWSLLALPLLVGASRLYRGMHHPSDVVAGLLLGALALALTHEVVLGGAVPRGRSSPGSSLGSATRPSARSSTKLSAGPSAGPAPRLRGGRT